MQHVARIREGERIYDLRGHMAARIRDGGRVYGSDGLSWIVR